MSTKCFKQYQKSTVDTDNNQTSKQLFNNSIHFLEKNKKTKNGWHWSERRKPVSPTLYLNQTGLKLKNNNNKKLQITWYTCFISHPLHPLQSTTKALKGTFIAHIVCVVPPGFTQWSFGVGDPMKLVRACTAACTLLPSTRLEVITVAAKVHDNKNCRRRKNAHDCLLRCADLACAKVINSRWSEGDGWI